MRKQAPVSRLISLLLAVALAAGLTFPAGAVASDWERLPWSSSDITPDPRKQQDLDRNEGTVTYDDDDIVRVSIVLEDASTLDKGFSTVGISRNIIAVAYRRLLQMKHISIEHKIESQALSGKSLDVVWDLTLAANMISANVRYGSIKDIKAVDGVKDVVLEAKYEPANVNEKLPLDPQMATSADQIGSTAAWADGYTGAGSTVAIIDTGIDIDHQSFNPDAFLYAVQQVRDSGKTVNLMDASSIQKVYSQLNIVKLGSYDGGPTGLYQNSKVPFAFNYVDKNMEITHDKDQQGEHGSHVSGISAANRYIPDKSSETGYANALESVYTQGVAPDAQIMTMKVFGASGGAYDSDYMAAIEDALVLEADAVNLSLGSAMAGYSRSEEYESVLNKLVKSDTVVSISMGNSGYWSSESSMPYLYGDDVNFSTGGSPGSYTNAFTVGSVDNIGSTGHYIKVGDTLIFYSETTDYENAPITSIASDEAYDYIFFNAYGRDSDFTGIDVTDKIVLCYRGDGINFSAKANAAAKAGAKAVIIVNNAPGTINMDLSDYEYSAPAISITQADGALIWAAAESTGKTESGIEYAEGKMIVAEAIGVNKGEVSEEGIYTLSSFSSWGVPGSLEMKPEILAPGGNIYSVNGADTSGKAYENMSGTSMAAPQVTGMAAVVAQYISLNPDKFADVEVTQRALINSLLMSTAKPVMEDYGDGNHGFYSILAQGAGLANVGSALHAQAYILMDAKANAGAADGKVKVELGDDPEKDGTYDFSFTLYNTSGKENVYTLGTKMFTQALFTDVNALKGEGTEYLQLDTWTTPIGFTESYTVNGNDFDPEARIDADVNKDGYTNDDDAQAILDYIAGIVEDVESIDLKAADVDGDENVTTYDAHLILEGIEARLTVPAGGKADITVHIVITEDLSAYVNGAYIEGFTYVYPVASEEGELDVEYSIPILGFYGNWTDPSMYDRLDLEDYFYPEDEYYTGYTGQYGNELDYKDGDDRNDYYLFGNPYGLDAEYHPDRDALSSNDILTGYYYTLIRNAGARALVIYNAENEPVYISPVASEYAAFYYTNQSAWQYTTSGINLGAKLSELGLNDGDRFTVKMYAVPEYYLTDAMYEDGVISEEEFMSVIGDLGKGAVLSKTAVVDDKAPEFTSDPMKNLNTNDLSIKVKDNQYIAYAAVLTRSGTVLYTDITADEIGAAAPGEETELIFSGEELAGAGEYVAIAVYDYAGNMSIIETKYGERKNVDGKMFGFTKELSDFTDGDPEKSWYEIDPSIIDILMNDVGYYLVDGSNIDVVNAEYIDAYSFQTGADGALYVAPQSDPGYTTRIAKLSVDIVDMAYDYTRNELYALGADNAVYEIEPLTGKATLAFNVSGVSGALAGIAIDDEGTFYFSGSHLYVVSSWDGETDTATAEGKTASLPQYSSILAWDHDNDTLYMLRSVGDVNFNNILYVVDTDTGSYTASGENRGYLFATFTALYVVPSDKGDSDIDDTETTKVESVTVSPENTTVMVGGSFRLTADVTPWTLSDKTVTWQSSDEGVAKVDAAGYVTTVGVGTATITATSTLDGTKSATATVNVEPLPAYELEGLIYDDDNMAYWSTFNTQAPGEFDHVTQGSYFYAGTLNAYGTTIYTHDGEYIYAVDSNTLQATPLFAGAASVFFPDAAPNFYFALGTAGDDTIVAAAPNSATLLLLLPGQSSGYNVNLGSAITSSIVGIAYIGSSSSSQSDYYYLLTENGDLYQIYISAQGRVGYGLVGNTGLDLTGAASASGGASASLIYDFANGDDYTEFLYVTHYKDGDDTAYLSVIEIDYTEDFDVLSCASRASVPFGDKVWPVVSLMDPTDIADNGNAVYDVAHKIAKENSAFALSEAEYFTKDSGENAAAEEKAVAGSLNAVTVDSETDASGKKQYNVIDTENNKVTVKVSAADSTNGLIKLEYDSDLFKLESVTGLTAYNGCNASDNTVVFDYASADALNAQIVTFVFSYEEKDELFIDTVIKVITEEDGKPGAEAVTEEIPVKVTHDHKLNKTEEVPATCTESGRKAYYTCELCGLIFEDAEGTVPTTMEQLVTAATGHKLSKVDEKPATCTEAGVKAHFKCDNCGKIFTDDTGAEETTLDKLAIAAKGHSFTVKNVSEDTLRTPANHHEAATYFYTCSECGAVSDTEWFTEGEALPYNVSTGDSDTWNENDDTGITFVTDGDYEYVECVKVDGTEIPESAYTVDKDTMTVVLSPEYLKSLEEGEHTLTVVYSDGEASATFKVVKKADEPTPTPPTESPTQSPSIPETSDVGGNGSIFAAIAGTCVMALAMLGIIVLANKKKKNENA